MDNRFHRLGVRQNAKRAQDLGRFAVTWKEEDRRAFKTPTLLNVSLRAPYMHDGTLKTLESVIDFYDRGGDEAAQKSPLIFELGLSKDEKSDLVAFLGSLTGRLPGVSAPRRAASADFSRK
jgi:cytochrome c peroxidase